MTAVLYRSHVEIGFDIQLIVALGRMGRASLRTRKKKSYIFCFQLTARNAVNW